MNKYNVKFCRCGRVHFIEWESLEETCDYEDKSALVVCSNCGNVYLKWLSDCMEGKAWNSITIREEIFDEKSNIGKIIVSPGESIYMKTGKEATSMAGGRFIDWDSKDEDVTYEDRTTVDIEKTIRMIGDETKLRELSNYAVEINWKGTKYENSFNSR